jgi:hypothetical protein
MLGMNSHLSSLQMDFQIASCSTSLFLFFTRIKLLRMSSSSRSSHSLCSMYEYLSIFFLVLFLNFRKGSSICLKYLIKSFSMFGVREIGDFPFRMYII